MVTDDEFRQCIADVRAIAAESPELNELVDMSAVTGVAVNSETVRAAAGSPPAFAPQSRQAAIATSDIGFGMSRMYEMLIETKRPNTRVFRSRDEALRWLSLPQE